MSKEYDKYISDHKKAVTESASWMLKQFGVEGIKGVLGEFQDTWIGDIAREHDESKWKRDEYGPYDDFFYGARGINRKDGGSGTKGKADDDIWMAFNYAWLHHIHNNPHHWQHWVLINDDEEDGNTVLEMPDRYIFEMIADWWSFSWRNNDLYELFNWWNDHCDRIKLGIRTKEKVLKLFAMILDRLNECGGHVEDYYEIDGESGSGDEKDEG